MFRTSQKSELLWSAWKKWKNFTLKGCHSSNLAYLVRETTACRYPVPLKACSSVMPLLVTQPALHLPPPLFPWCGSWPFTALVHLIPNSCWDRRPFSRINWGLGGPFEFLQDPAMIIYLSTQGKREHSSGTVHPRYSMGQCTALHHVDT